MLTLPVMLTIVKFNTSNISKTLSVLMLKLPLMLIAQLMDALL